MVLSRNYIDMKKFIMMMAPLLTMSLSACIPALSAPTRSLSQGNKAKESNLFGYLLGLLIFVIGIPALMWLVSGRPWSYVTDSAYCTLSV